MAVPEPLRTPGKLKVITIARENAKKTIQLCKSEKHFPKANRWILTSKIVDAAENVYRYSIHANIINVKCREDYVKRRQLMMDAKAAAIEQLALIQIAYELLSLTVSMDDWMFARGSSRNEAVRKLPELAISREARKHEDGRTKNDKTI